MLNVGFHTLGCKVNQYETEAIIEIFEKRGYQTVDFDAYADIYIINTCTVTNIADKKSRKMLSKAKKMNPNAVVVAMGCYAQVAENVLKENGDIDLIIGNTKKSEVVDLVENYLKEHKKIKFVEDMTDQKVYEELWISRHIDKKRAHIKIQDGCNQFCSYCIIPYTRGRVRSRNPENIYTEIQQVIQNGYKEIVLTGIHLASYGIDLENTTLIELLEVINAMEGLKRIRLGSLEPTLMSPEFVERLAKLEKICPHFHLSLQSGCDATLKRMNRKYTTTEYQQAVTLLRSAYKNPAITTDIIVGFPSETDEEFDQTMAFVKQLAFADIHVFKYSKRQGTKAADMKAQIEDPIKHSRSQILTQVRDELYQNYLERFLGQVVEVLFEDGMEEDGKYYLLGHASNYMKVAVLDRPSPMALDLKNQMVTVELSGIKNDFIIGFIKEKLN